MFFEQRLLVALVSTLPFFHSNRNPMMAWMKITFLASFEAKCGHIPTCSCEGEVLVDLPGLAFKRTCTYSALPLSLSAG